MDIEDRPALQRLFAGEPDGIHGDELASLEGPSRNNQVVGSVGDYAFKLRVPLIGNLLRLTEVARFARTLGVLLRSGVPMLQALDIVRAVAGNQVIAQALNEVQVGVREGAGMAGPLGRSGVFPQLALQMIAVGEDTGKLDEMLITTADFFDRGVRNDVKRLTRLLEPALLLIMGLVVGFMVISMLMAVFSINDVDM